MWKTKFLIAAFLPLAALLAIAMFSPAPEREQPAPENDGSVYAIRDAVGRKVVIPAEVERVICSGSGCLRLLTYLQAQEMIVAVDSIERRGSVIDARPYALANKWFRTLPVFGEFRGQDSPEKIVGLEPLPQVILKTFGSWGHDAELLQSRTGIPVVLLEYGNLGARREDLNAALRIMGDVTGRSLRAEEVIAYFDALIEDLVSRTAGRGASPTCYVGGIAMRGPHGLHSTEPEYPPFTFLGAANVAASLSSTSTEISHAMVSREKIVAWDPEIIFLDLSTIRAGSGAGALHELRHHPAYRNLQAVRNGRVYGVLPYNSYAANFGSIFANAYFIGKVLHADAFEDVDPAAKADEIYTFLNGKPVFDEMNEAFGGLIFQQIPVAEEHGDEPSR